MDEVRTEQVTLSVVTPEFKYGNQVVYIHDATKAVTPKGINLSKINTKFSVLVNTERDAERYANTVVSPSPFTHSTQYGEDVPVWFLVSRAPDESLPKKMSLFGGIHDED